MYFKEHKLLHTKSWLVGKDPDAGKNWRQEKKGTTEDEMAGCHPWLDGRESEWTPGVGDGHGDLACCDSWGRKESDTTEQLIWRVWEKNKMSCRGQQWASCLHALDSRWERKKNFFLRFSNPKLSCAIEFAQIPLMCTFTLKRDEWVLSVVPHTEQT